MVISIHTIYFTYTICQKNEQKTIHQTVLAIVIVKRRVSICRKAYSTRGDMFKMECQALCYTFF